MFQKISIEKGIIVTMTIVLLGMLIISISSYQGFNKIGSEIDEIAQYYGHL